jgi:hypothetical protein
VHWLQSANAAKNPGAKLPENIDALLTTDIKGGI